MGMLARDEAAVVRLYLQFGSEIGAAVRGLVYQSGGRHLTNDDIEGLTFDACLALARVAGAWRADGGALPWVWGRKRLAALVAEHLGPLCRGLPNDGEISDRPAVHAVFDGDELGAVLTKLAGRDPRCALVRTALRDELGPRDAEVLLRYVVQQNTGDPSPSHTVAVEMGLQPPTVRQVASRARRKLAKAISRDERYAELAGIALLAPAGEEAA